MHITRVYIDGFRRLKEFDLELNAKLNVIVGDNETGKTSVLEAINLVLSRQVDGRNIDYSLDPYLFNATTVANYIKAIRSGTTISPPRILVEVYFSDETNDAVLAKLKGTNNTRNEDCPGLSLSIELDSENTEALKDYVRDESNPELLPVEYYRVRWSSFAGEIMTARTVPIKGTVIDTSAVRRYRGPDSYVAQIVGDVLTVEQRRQLGLAYKKLRHKFTAEDGVAAINRHLEQQGSVATKKKLTVQMDTSSRSTWDSAIIAHLDDLPFDCVGKGEQCRVQMRLAIAGASKSRVLLIEEPENHLSHSNMSMLMQEIMKQCDDKHQVILTTHSAYVLNKLGLDNMKLVAPTGKSTSLKELDSSTKDYFMKLPGYDTLRLILSRRSILVEGPSDELIVQRAYKDKHGKLPIEDGVDVISVGSLAFKRFLEIATPLKLNVCVLADNDGNVEALKDKYKEYMKAADTTVRILYDDDTTCMTLEPQLLKANSLAKLNRILGKEFSTDDVLLHYMSRNKTDCALQLFETKEKWSTPKYISDAIESE